MQYCIVGYSWCPHFLDARKRLLSESSNVYAVELQCDDPDRDRIRNEVQHLIGTRRKVGLPAETSPQIVCRNSKIAVCIPGESNLNAIDNLSAYLERVSNQKRGSYRLYMLR